jgi:hypothetical protein
MSDGRRFLAAGLLILALVIDLGYQKAACSGPQNAVTHGSCPDIRGPIATYIVQAVGYAVEHDGFIVAVATVLVAAFTFTLWRSTDRLWQAAQRQGEDMKLSLQISKEAADAAKASTEGLFKIERAYVFANVHVRNGMRIGEEPATSVTFVNRGKTPAIVLRMRSYLTVSKAIPQELAHHKRAEIRLPEGYIIGASLALLDFPKQTFTPQEVSDIENMTTRLFAVGLIEYKDVLEAERETSFCWEYQPIGGDFVLCRESSLNRWR